MGAKQIETVLHYPQTDSTIGLFRQLVRTLPTPNEMYTEITFNVPRPLPNCWGGKSVDEYKEYINWCLENGIVPFGIQHTDYSVYNYKKNQFQPYHQSYFQMPYDLSNDLRVQVQAYQNPDLPRHQTTIVLASGQQAQSFKTSQLPNILANANPTEATINFTSSRENSLKFVNFEARAAFGGDYGFKCYVKSGSRSIMPIYADQLDGATLVVGQDCDEKIAIEVLDWFNKAGEIIGQRPLTDAVRLDYPNKNRFSATD